MFLPFPFRRRNAPAAPAAPAAASPRAATDVLARRMHGMQPDMDRLVHAAQGLQGPDPRSAAQLRECIEEICLHMQLLVAQAGPLLQAGPVPAATRPAGADHAATADVPRPTATARA